MPQRSSPYHSDHYPDTKSEATYVDDRRMPTPWEGEVHELRERVTNQYPTRPRDYGPNDDYIRQLRADTSDYHRPPRRSNKIYDSLCCGSKLGILAWVVAILGIIIALTVLLIKVLKPEVFTAPAAEVSTSLQPSTVTVTASSSPVSVSTSTVFTYSTETESTVSTTTLITETTKSTTTTQTYTPPTTATETETTIHTATSVATVTPLEPDTVTSTPQPSTVSVTTTSLITTSHTTTEPETTTQATTIVTTTSIDSAEEEDEDEGGGDNKRNEDTKTTSSKISPDNTQTSFPTTTGGPPDSTPLASLQDLQASASDHSSQSVLSTQIEAAISFCSEMPKPSRDASASEFCGDYPIDLGGGGPAPPSSTSSAPAKRHYNFFARAAPLAAAKTPKPELDSREASAAPSSPSLPTSTAATCPLTQPPPSLPHLLRRVFGVDLDREKPLQVGTHAIGGGLVDCVESAVLCEFSLVFVGILSGMLVMGAAWTSVFLLRRRKQNRAPTRNRSSRSRSRSRKGKGRW